MTRDDTTPERRTQETVRLPSHAVVEVSAPVVSGVSVAWDALPALPGPGPRLYRLVVAGLETGCRLKEVCCFSGGTSI